MAFDCYAPIEEVLDCIITRNELPHSIADMALFAPPTESRPGSWLEKSSNLASAGLCDRVCLTRLLQ
jgi:hypothetical protein